MGVTRSGRVYTNPEIAGKGKAPAASRAAPEAPPIPQKKVTEEEAEAFMKVIKASEYKVVEQMGKSPAHISLLALLLSLGPHREALLRVLTAAQVPKETAPDRIEETEDPRSTQLELFPRPCTKGSSSSRRVDSLRSRVKRTMPSIRKRMYLILASETTRIFHSIHLRLSQSFGTIGRFVRLVLTAWSGKSFCVTTTFPVPGSEHRGRGSIAPSRLKSTRTGGVSVFALPATRLSRPVRACTSTISPHIMGRSIGASRLHSNPNLRHVDSNSSEEHLEESRPIYFGEGLDEDGRVPEIEESLCRLENRQFTSVEPTEEFNVGLDPSIVKHFLPLDTERFPPKRQHLRRQRAGLLLRIKEEVIKQINAGFLEVCNYFEWVANIVPVEKKDGKVRACVDYRDLNKASPKDNFPLHHIDVLVDNTARHTLFSFMDDFFGYNQIRMADEDKIKTTFIKMAMVTLFHDMMHKEIEVYVDDMIAKSKEGEDHLVNLKPLFDRLKKYKLRLNSAKCGSKSGKLLGFVVSERGNEVDPDKVKAIRELPPPSTVRELTKYDIEYVPRTSVKGQAIADHLAEFPIEDDTPINSDFPDEGILQVDSEESKFAWMMYFDGAVNSTGSCFSAVLISPDGRYYPVAAKVDFPCTNNVVEYEACIIGLQAAIDFKVKELEVFGDSMLTIFQTLGQWKTKDAKLVPYHEYLEELAENFEKISFTYTPRMKNQFANALATLASMVSITKENLIEPLEIEIAKGLAHCDARIHGEHHKRESH
ncbi:hypothetical protein CRG98_033800 [Punica granatum]|uniref:RNase H type-1 domain-containing protein n=1 Tax=Punica granatum TaxID=22663 RepID=A0A2I0IQ04_PUNGR|nr:hypothetical protein CRG98_033800 [Punica granatum]